MKKLTKILIIALSVALLCGAFIFAASAEETVPEATTHNAFRVEKADGTLVGEYVKLKDAFSNVPDGGKITMIADFEEGLDNAGNMTFAAGKTAVLDLNGHKISLSCATGNKADGTESLCYQKHSISGTLTITGNGTIESATTPFIVGYGGKLNIDAGEGNTINFVAKKSYNKDTGKISSNTFPSGQYLKMGANAASGGKGVATLNITGNVNFTDNSGKASLYFIAISDGSVLDINHANINSVTNGTGSGFITNFFNGNYAPEDYVAPRVTIRNKSVITSPYGKFLYETNTKVTNYWHESTVEGGEIDATCLTVTDSVLNLVGDKYPTSAEGYLDGDIMTTEQNSPMRIELVNTKVYTDMNLVSTRIKTDTVPNVTVKIDGCLVSFKTYGGPLTNENNETYRRNLFYGAATAIVKDTDIISEASNPWTGYLMRYTHAWCSGTDAAEKYTDPGYFTELGMGVKFVGNVRLISGASNAIAAPVSAGTYSSGYAGYSLEAGKNFVYGALVWLDGVPHVSWILSDKSAADFTKYDAVKRQAYNAFDNTIVGVIGAGGNFETGNASTSTGNLGTHGVYTICQSNDGNRYFTFQNKGTGGDPYVSINYNNAKMKDVKFYSYDFDMASATYKHSRGNFNFGFLYYVNNGEKNIAQYAYIYYKTDTSFNSYWTFGSTVIEDTRNAYTPGEWEHIQIIFEVPEVGDTFDATAFADNFKVYLYINGEQIASAKVSSFASNLTDPISSKAFYESAYLNSIRLRFPNESDTTGITALDNMFARTYSKTYAGNLDSIVTKSNEYAHPENFPVVKVDGVPYNDLADAKADFVSRAKGGHVPTFEYVMDLPTQEFDFSGAAAGARFIVKTGGKTFNIKSGSGYSIYNGAHIGELGEGETLVVPTAYNTVDVYTKLIDIQNATTGTYISSEYSLNEKDQKVYKLMLDGEVVENGFGSIPLDSIRGRNGLYTICQYGDNKYLVHQNHRNVGNTDPMLWLSEKNGKPNDLPMGKTRFHSFEMDFASAELKNSEGKFSIRFYFSGGGIANYIEVNFDGKSWTMTDNGASNKTYTVTGAPVAAPGVWQHVQVIIETPVKEYNENTPYYSAELNVAKIGEYKVHLYLDGECVDTVELSEFASAFVTKLEAGTDYNTAALQQIRFRFPTAYKPNDTGATAYDNIKIDRYNINYTGDATNNADVLASIVNTNPSTPTDLPLVKVDGVGYSSIPDAVAELKNGSTLEYAMDVSTLEFDLSAFKNGETFTFNTNGKKVNLKASALYKAIDNGDGKYTVRPANEDEKATVIWYDNEGNVLHTDVVFKGAEVPMYVNPNPVVLPDNGYYKATYSAWKLNDGTFLVDGTVTANDNITATPAAVLESTFNDLKFNMELNDNMALQFYIPADFAQNQINGIKYTGSLMGAADKNPEASTVTIEEKSYVYFRIFTGYQTFTNNTKWTVKYTVELDGFTYNLSREFSISPLGYTDYVLSDTTDTFADAKEHVANLLRFANEFMRAFNNGAHNQAIKAIYEKHKSLCTQYEDGYADDILNETNVNLTEIDDYIDSVYFTVSGGRVQYIVRFEEGSNIKLADFKISKRRVINNITNQAAEIIHYGNQYFPKKDAEGNIIYTDEKDSNKNPIPEYTEYLYEYRTNYLKFYDFFGTLTIKITVPDGNGGTKTVVGTYDINTWYNNTSFKNENEKAMYADLLKAIKALGDSLFDYRFEKIEE